MREDNESTIKSNDERADQVGATANHDGQEAAYSQDGTTTSAVDQCIGRVGAPPPLEATSGEFAFWIPAKCAVEKGEIVLTRSQIGEHNITFYGIVTEVHRCSRRRSMGHEYDEYDGDPSESDGNGPIYQSEGYTYATVSVLRTEPARYLPPRERSAVTRAGDGQAQTAYGIDEIMQGRAMPLGLIKNGGEEVAGPGSIDLDYLLGENGGHMNVNGSAGRGTKSSFLLHTVRMLLNKAEQERREAPSSPDRLRVIPVVLNVKGFDLIHIDRRSRRFQPEKDLADWQALGVSDPIPFYGAEFLAPQHPKTSQPISTGRGADVRPYSWSLSDIIEQDLFELLFADDDVNDPNFGALLDDFVASISIDRTGNDGETYRRLTDDAPRTFAALLDAVDNGYVDNLTGDHHTGTRRKFKRRFRSVIRSAYGILRERDEKGNPLNVVRADTCAPIVIDINSLVANMSLQRFVVAAVLKQIIGTRTNGSPIQGLRYVVLIDELNRFAPKGGRDPITKLVESIASEMRSHGIILLGAQQQASKVSEKVIENAAIRVLGKSGMMELSNSCWSGLSKAAKTKADALLPSEKLIIQDNFREPMHLRVPFPAWPMRREEVDTAGERNSDNSGETAGRSIERLISVD